jgi:hypothetical protein
MNRSIAAVIASLVAILAVVGLLTGESGSDEQPGAADRSEPSVAAVAHGVERVRRLRFERLPRVRHVSAAQARTEALRELDRETPPAEVAAEERLLKLLELLPADAKLRDLLGETYSGEIGGYYLPRTRTLALVGSDSGRGLLGEITLAHELTHALEDQHFGIESHGSTGYRRDRSTAETALHEGTATIAMVDYAVLSKIRTTKVPASVREEALGALDKTVVPASSGLPRYLREGLVFPYAAGARLVNGIEARGGWSAVDRALEDPPVSTEQVMHPAKYETRERPVHVRVRPPSGVDLIEQGDFGEFDTEQLLRAANGRERARRAAAGWGGGGFALWRAGGDRYGLELRWTWDSPRDAAEFARAVRRTARRLGSATVESSDNGVSLALAPRR